MPIAENPQTGEVLFLDNGKWSPAKIAENPQTGERVVFDGEAWKPLASQNSIGTPTQMPEQGYLERATNTLMNRWENPSPTSAIGIVRGAVDMVRPLLGSFDRAIHEGGLDPVLDSPENLAANSIKAAAVLSPAARGRFLSPNIGRAAAPAPATAPAIPQVVQAGEELGVGIPKFLATENTGTQRAAQSVGAFPIAGEAISRAANKLVSDLGEKASGVASSLGGGTRFGAGTEARSALKSWIKKGSADELENAYNAVDGLVTPNVVTRLENTANALADINLQNTNARLPPSEAGSLLKNALEDPQGLNYFGIKRLRSFFGKDMPQGLVANIPDAERRQIYAALTKDLKNSVARSGGKPALDAWENANSLAANFATAKKELTRILNVKGDAAPETVIARIEQMAGSSGRADLNGLMLAKKTMGQDAWNEVGSSIVSNLGRDAENLFSTERFLTSWGKMSDGAKKLLFEGEHAKTLNNIAKVSSEIRGKITRFMNTSRTTQVGLGAAGLTGLTIDPITTLATFGGVALVARALSSPVTAKSFATYARAQQRVFENPSTANIFLFHAASRKLAMDVGDGRLASALQSLIPAAAEDQANGANRERQ